ncbi:unnamed protein product [Lactuca saligna]|uniref:Uncharacterized protein n=1 Tax=Lactuca saligna TaxID=75948 RepID=A0AA35YRA2_LACSI|nr:unnamed protein product [Lactuca saligna]
MKLARNWHIVVPCYQSNPNSSTNTVEHINRLSSSEIRSQNIAIGRFLHHKFTISIIATGRFLFFFINHHDNIEPVICFCPDNIEPYLSAEPAVVMKKAKLDSTIEPAVVVAPHDVDLEEDDINVVDVDVKIKGDEELSLEELTDDVMQMDNKDTKVEDV